MIGLLAAAVVFAGGLVGVERLNACEGCPAHAKATKVESVKSAAAEEVDAKASSVESVKSAAVEAVDAKVTKANVTKASCAATCASKAAHAKLTGASATCARKMGVKSASSTQWCADEKDHAKGELMTAEATLAKLAHCGIDVRSADATELSTKLAEKGCCDYTQEQWAAMIKSARALDADQAEVLYAEACKGEPCKSENCPMTLVARDLATEKAETENN
jgi:hypothetical protein